eukprot:ANDGO_07017.mRNA.2 hypothetical protein
MCLFCFVFGRCCMQWVENWIARDGRRKIFLVSEEFVDSFEGIMLQAEYSDVVLENLDFGTGLAQKLWDLSRLDRNIRYLKLHRCKELNIPLDHEFPLFAFPAFSFLTHLSICLPYFPSRISLCNLMNSFHSRLVTFKLGTVTGVLSDHPSIHDALASFFLRSKDLQNVVVESVEMHRSVVLTVLRSVHKLRFLKSLLLSISWLDVSVEDEESAASATDDEIAVDRKTLTLLIGTLPYACRNLESLTVRLLPVSVDRTLQTLVQSVQFVPLRKPGSNDCEYCGGHCVCFRQFLTSSESPKIPMSGGIAADAEADVNRPISKLTKLRFSKIREHPRYNRDESVWDKNDYWTKVYSHLHIDTLEIESCTISGPHAQALLQGCSNGHFNSVSLARTTVSIREYAGVRENLCSMLSRDPPITSMQLVFSAFLVDEEMISMHVKSSNMHLRYIHVGFNTNAADRKVIKILQTNRDLHNAMTSRAGIVGVGRLLTLSQLHSGERQHARCGDTHLPLSIFGLEYSRIFGFQFMTPHAVLDLVQHVTVSVPFHSLHSIFQVLRAVFAIHFVNHRLPATLPSSEYMLGCVVFFVTCGWIVVRCVEVSAILQELVLVFPFLEVGGQVVSRPLYDADDAADLCRSIPEDDGLELLVISGFSSFMEAVQRTAAPHLRHIFAQSPGARSPVLPSCNTTVETFVEVQNCIFTVQTTVDHSHSRVDILPVPFSFAVLSPSIRSQYELGEQILGDLEMLPEISSAAYDGIVEYLVFGSMKCALRPSCVSDLLRELPVFMLSDIDSELDEYVSRFLSDMTLRKCLGYSKKELEMLREHAEIHHLSRTINVLHDLEHRFEWSKLCV